jgi:hypothetical protein
MMINRSNAWLMLFARSLLFLAFQALAALVLGSWDATARWWVFFAIGANLVTIPLLVRLFRAEGRSYGEAVRFSRSTLKTDLLWFFGSSIIGLPIAAAPMTFLAVALFGDRMIPVHMMFRPLPTWALVLGILFPLTIAFAELPAYFGYVMPRLFPDGNTPRSTWAAWLIASFFLGAQHMFLPFLPDGRFLLWRLGMYLPFALFAGLVLKLRPTLLPYFMIIHALMDFSALSVYFMI